MQPVKGDTFFVKRTDAGHKQMLVKGQLVKFYCKYHDGQYMVLDSAGSPHAVDPEDVEPWVPRKKTPMFTFHFRILGLPFVDKIVSFLSRLKP